MSETPKGVVAVFVGPDGRQIASVSDFNQNGYGGFSLEEAQTSRVKDSIASAVADMLCSSAFTKHLDNYRKREVLSQMQTRDGYHLHIIPIGHPPTT